MEISHLLRLAGTVSHVALNDIRWRLSPDHLHLVDNVASGWRVPSSEEELARQVITPTPHHRLVRHPAGRNHLHLPDRVTIYTTIDQRPVRPPMEGQVSWCWLKKGKQNKTWKRTKSLWSLNSPISADILEVASKSERKKERKKTSFLKFY
jgi:hypothetical protein